MDNHLPPDLPLNLADSGSSSKRKWKSTGYRFWPFLYEQGFIDGALKTDEQPFEAYIEFTQERKKVFAQLEEIRTESAKVRQEIQRIDADKADGERNIIHALHQLENLDRKITEKEQTVQGLTQEIKSTQEKIQHLNPKPNLFSAIVLLTASAVFFAAEVTISVDVFFNILKLEGIKGWLFAGAIAVLSIGLKPAMDRLGEEPYLNGRKDVMKWFLGFFALVTMVFLGLLGHFRMNGEKVNNSGGNTQGEISYNSFAPAVGEISNPNIYNDNLDAIFIISSILFAVMGATCLSIGLPLLYAQRQKRSHQKSIKALNEKVEGIRLSREALFEEVVRCKQNADEAKARLADLPDKALLDSRLQALQEKEQEVIAALYQAKSAADTAWYRSGYERGILYQLNGKLVISPADFPTSENQEPLTKNEAPIIPLTGNRFLHERLRTWIGNNFNRSQKKSVHE